MAYRHISLPQPFAQGDPKEWFRRFEICCKANAWDADAKAAKLPTLLEGEALAVWLELEEAEQGDYEVARGKIMKRMAPLGFTSLEDFHSRKLHPGEALSVFLHELKSLLEQAMPDLDAQTRKQLLLHQFLTGLPTVVSRQLRATGEIHDLEKALERAKLLMTIKDEEQTAAVKQKDNASEMDELKQQISRLSEQVAALTVQRPGAKGSTQPVCYSCRQPGHLQRNCPSLRRAPTCYTCGRRGHLARNCRQGNGSGAPEMGRGRPQRQ